MNLRTNILLVLFFSFIQFYAQNSDNKTKILVLFHSENGGTFKMAQAISEGATKLPNTEVFLKQIPTINKSISKGKSFENYPIATIDELVYYDGIAFGSPVHFGNMSVDIHYFLNQSLDLWVQKKLEGKPATVFMSAGSGAAKETAILSLWNILALHGMIIIPTGLMGTENLDKSIPQGNTPFGASSLANSIGERPSKSELNIAIAQGFALAKAANGLKNSSKISIVNTQNMQEKFDVNEQLKKENINLPEVPKPVGNYVPFIISNNQVYINQVALLNGKVLNPGKIEVEVSEEQAKEATYQTMLNVISVLKQATNGDLNRVKKVVQLTGFFNTLPDFTKHASIMNSASDLVVKIFGEKGKHARATIGANSLPLNSSVEIQAIFEIN